MTTPKLYTINPKAWIKYAKTHYRCYIGETLYIVDDDFADLFFNLYGEVFKKNYLHHRFPKKSIHNYFNDLIKIKFFVPASSSTQSITNNDQHLLKEYPNLSSYQMFQASKNGRVYTVMINNKKYIFKFQSTANDLSFLESLKEKFIPNIKDYNFKSKLYIQEFIDGINLYEWKNSYLKDSQIYTIIQQLNAIEKTLKKTKIIHGDLHPHNFIFKNNTLYLIDWDNAFIQPLPKKLITTIKPTGLDGFCHPDIKKGKIFPNQNTQHYSFKKIKEYLIR